EQACEVLRGEISNLDAELAQLDSFISSVQESQKLEPREHLYMRHDLLAEMDCYSDSSVIAIRAPEGTVLDVPDPDLDMPSGKRRFQVYLKSPNHEGVDVFLVKGSCIGDSSIEHGTDVGYGGVSSGGYSNAEAAKAAVQQVLSAGGRERAGSIDRIRPAPSMSVPSTPDILQNLPKSTLQPGYTPNLGSLPTSPAQLADDAISLQAFSSPMKKGKNANFASSDFVGISTFPRTPDTYASSVVRSHRPLGVPRLSVAVAPVAPLTPAQHKMLSIGSSQTFSPSPRPQTGTPAGGAMQSPGLRHQINGREGVRDGTHSLNPSPVATAAASSYLKGKGDKYDHGRWGEKGDKGRKRRNVTGTGQGGERR
ncbi:hypothetical protein TrRE_jg901, partial [Triparma retinervis]